MATKKDDKKKDPPKAAKKADPPKKATPAPAAKKVEAAAKKPEPKASKAAVKRTPNIKPGTAPTAKQKALANVAGAAGKAAGVTGGGTTPARTQTVKAETVKPPTKTPPATTTPPAGTKPGTTTTSSSGVPRSTTVSAKEVKGKPGNKPISNYRKEIKKDKKFDKRVEKAKEYVRQAATRPVTGMAGPGQDTRKAMALIAKARIKNRQEAMDDRAGAAAQKLVRSKMTPEEKKADKLLLRGKDPNASWKDINKAREAAGKDRLKGSVIRERKHETMDTRTAKGLDPKTGKPPVVKPTTPTTPTTPVKPTTPTTPVKPAVDPAKPVVKPTTPTTPTTPKPPTAPPPTTTAAPKTDNWVDAARK